MVRFPLLFISDPIAITVAQGVRQVEIVVIDGEE